MVTPNQERKLSHMNVLLIHLEMAWNLYNIESLEMAWNLYVTLFGYLTPDYSFETLNWSKSFEINQ